MAELLYQRALNVHRKTFELSHDAHPVCLWVIGFVKLVAGGTGDHQRLEPARLTRARVCWKFDADVDVGVRAGIDRLHASKTRQLNPCSGNALFAAALSRAMDIVALTELKSRALEALTSAHKYRALAGRHSGQRDFYRALATTYQRSAREMEIMLDKAERAHTALSNAA